MNKQIELSKIGADSGPKPHAYHALRTGDGQAFAHRLDADWTMDIKVAAQIEYAGNQNMPLPVLDVAAPLVTGSRMDSVRHAANFEDAASIIHDMKDPSSTIANGSTATM